MHQKQAGRKKKKRGEEKNKDGGCWDNKRGNLLTGLLHWPFRAYSLFVGTIYPRAVQLQEGNAGQGLPPMQS